MVSEAIQQKYQPTIGIETHVQLKTKTKLFSAISNDARKAEPNNLISHIDTGMPGALPVLNQLAIQLTCRAGFALKSRPQKFSRFDRKHYFYPDLPKGYQITQYESPIIVGGQVDFKLEGEAKSVRIVRVHLEEDAGKNIHPDGADYSLIDLNRAGTPLLEIVSQPDMHSAAEAKAYVRELYLLMKYADVSDVDLYHGNLRFDVNISVSPEAGKLGKRSEIKNLNSFRSVENAVTYEINRQIDLYESGKKNEQETRGWDEAKQKTTSQRGKEEAQDYRYMPEPDIPPLQLNDEFLHRIEASMPLLPAAIREKLNKLDITATVIDDVLDNPSFIPRLLKINEQAGPENARQAVFDLLRDAQVLSVSLDDHIKVSQMTAGGRISSNSAVLLLNALKTETDAEAVAKKLNLLQLSDRRQIETIVTKVITENPKVVEDITNGEMKAIGYLVGQVMAQSRGQANPLLAQQIIKKQLNL